MPKFVLVLLALLAVFAVISSFSGDNSAWFPCLIMILMLLIGYVAHSTDEVE